MRRFDGQVALVTGASSGLGRQMALDLAQRGARVVGVARTGSALDELAAAHDHLEGRVVDVSQPGSLAAAVEEVAADAGRLDVLVNAAGFEEPTTVEAADVDLYRRIFDTNFFAVVEGTLAAAGPMLRQRSGVVVNVSSDHGRAPAPGTPAYSASKAAVSAFTESIAHEVHGTGVHVHVMYPGWVPTALGQGAVDHGMPTPPRPVRRTAAQVSAITLERMGGPGIEINCARLATLAPVMRALAPRVYRSQMRRQAVGGSGH